MIPRVSEVQTQPPPAPPAQVMPPSVTAQVSPTHARAGGNTQITITPKNAGHGPTTGTKQVSVDLPDGMSNTQGEGTGWD